MRVLGIKNLTGGLSNQKMALLGLLATAKESGAYARFPSQMVDFVPRATPQQPERFLFPELFDLDCFRKAILGEPTSTELATDYMPFSDAFPRGFSECMSETPAPYVIKFMLGMRASEGLSLIAFRVLEWLDQQNAFALQLRIERDWQAYVSSATQSKRMTTSDTTDPREIFRRIRASPSIDEYGAFYACCDEDDLSISKGDLHNMAAEFRLKIIFKSDLPAAILMPTPLLMRSMIDFTICDNIQTYVGLTKSTFSRTVYKNAVWSGRSASHFSYNANRDHLRSERCSVFADKKA